MEWGAVVIAVWLMWYAGEPRKRPRRPMFDPGDPTDWYISRRMYIMRPGFKHYKTFCYLQGTSPMNRYAFDTGVIGEHARWIIDHSRDERIPYFKKEPPPVSELAMVEIDPVSEAGGWILTAVALWSAIR